MPKKFHFIWGLIYLALFVALSLIIYFNFQSGPMEMPYLIDDAFLQDFIIDQRTPFLTEFFEKIALGFGPRWGFVTAAVLALLVLIFKKTERWVAGLYLIVMALLGTGISAGLKILINRDRPDLEALVTETSKSFPSGHTIFATMLFGGLLLIIASKTESLLIKVLFAIFASLLIAIVMVSRVYLGVHYPSDTIGSILLGGALLHLTYPLFYKLSHPMRGRHQR